MAILHNIANDLFLTTQPIPNTTNGLHFSTPAPKTIALSSVFNDSLNKIANPAVQFAPRPDVVDDIIDSIPVPLASTSCLSKNQFIRRGFSTLS